MSVEFLAKLSNADGIASNESEVRDLLVEECSQYADEVFTDNLGSVIFRKGNTGPKIMLCAHIDEVGFIVRSISEQGQLFVMPVGGVKPMAQVLHQVRITTSKGDKVLGIINATYENGQVSKQYVDIGATSDKEVIDLGVSIGDMVTYATEFKEYNLDGIVVGKAFDDRLGCYVIAQVLKRVSELNLPNTIYVVGTSSEEVGIRGAKTATTMINPDVVLPIDVACFNDEFVRNHTNKRQIGKGMMQTNFDRTLAPNKKLIQKVRDVAQKCNKPLQLDMFNTGGTDGGEAHKCNIGIPTAVSCIPVRYGHCAYSIANLRDIEDSIEIFVELLKVLDEKECNALIQFIERKEA